MKAKTKKKSEITSDQISAIVDHLETITGAVICQGLDTSTQTVILDFAYVFDPDGDTERMEFSFVEFVQWSERFIRFHRLVVRALAHQTCSECP